MCWPSAERVPLGLHYSYAGCKFHGTLMIIGRSLIGVEGGIACARARGACISTASLIPKAVA